MHDKTYFRELLISNSANGYRDLLAKVELDSFRRIPWEGGGDDGKGGKEEKEGPGGVPFFLVSFYDPVTLEPISPCPRGLLAKTVERLGEHGWQAMAGGRFPPPPHHYSEPLVVALLDVLRSPVCCRSGVRILQLQGTPPQPRRE